ncbi:TIGR00645 family protein [Vitreimonas flagellata]|uniref:TIGR00645 family protein n=1 Tax=Vitreimonas flagellata TaxID=2560861 RepID=UPI001075881D|nr:TIGR00645 family protein [Vitreimonas flagellata]
MTDDAKSRRSRTPLLEAAIEWIIYTSRWLMAPVYLGLIAALGILIVTFFRELYLQMPQVLTMDETDIILLVLTLVDLSLAGNLVLIILFSGYENFVSKMDAAKGDPDRPEWMGTLDFSGLKIKLIASIVAISGIHLLKIFMNIHEYEEQHLLWYTIIHMVFIVSGVAFALMDWIVELSHKVNAKHD